LPYLPPYLQAVAVTAAQKIAKRTDHIGFPTSLDRRITISALAFVRLGKEQA
jgi:hypothetical protein